MYWRLRNLCFFIIGGFLVFSCTALPVNVKMPSYLAPVGVGAKGADEADFNAEASRSAFILFYRGKTFQVLSAHSAVWIIPGGRLFFNYKNLWWPISSKVVVGFKLDLAAADVTDVFPYPNEAGELETDMGGMVMHQTPLYFICNPLRFRGVSEGRFSGFKKPGNYPSFPGFSVDFPAGSIRKDCSSSPLFSVDGRIVGMLVGSSKTISADIGYVIPAKLIASFLDENFFQ